MSSDDRIGELLKLAGRREMPDAAQMSRARAAARAEWTHVAAGRRRPFRLWVVSGAAVVAVALAAIAVWVEPEEAARSSIAVDAEVATLETVVGTVHVLRDGSAPSVVSQRGLRLLAGDRLDTAAGGRVVFAAAGGTSIKVDGDSTVVLDAADSLTLSAGAVFVDAMPGVRDADVHVRTSLGVVRHLGTQFEVRLGDGALRVRVREGTVAVENADGRWISHEGEALRVAPGRAPERQAILTHGAEWNWVNDLAPPFTLEGATLGAFLEWAGRHHGLRWQYADPELRTRADAIILHGSIEDLSADETLEAVLRTCGLAFRRDGTRLTIIKRTDR